MCLCVCFFREIVDIDVIEKDGFFDIFYALNDPGDYDINVKFGGKDIPNGSFSIKVVWLWKPFKLFKNILSPHF